MAILVVCGGCQRRFSAPDRGAGRRVPCPHCRATIAIPTAEPPDDLLAPASHPSIAADGAPKRYWSPPQRAATAVAPSAPAARVAFPVPPAPVATPAAPAIPVQPAWIPPTKSTTPLWLRHLHWLLALAMIPLAISVLVPSETEEELIARIERSIPSASDTPAAENTEPTNPIGGNGADELPETDWTLDLDELTVDDLLALVPGGKLEGAFLPRDTWWHWSFALISVAAYMTFFVFLASDGSAKAWHLLAVGAFVATFGILLLVIVQVASMIGVGGGSGPESLFRLLFLLIGLSYRAALDPEIGFFGSFVGFTLGVGLCEELCKALPLFIYYRFNPQQSWRGAFLWGLAAGAGFGVAEGIIYSQDFYNGIMGPGIYLVRFISCVALHAVWTGTIGIAINQRQDQLLWNPEQWWRLPLGVMGVIVVPMVLHGLYDTMLKKEWEFLALAVAAASFGYLAWSISRLRTSDDEDERAAYVARYIRSRAAARQKG